ncbi:MAG: TonB family protein [Firmicutes bacterium]|nr:TonB family protein [Bacillota bacterium]
MYNPYGEEQSLNKFLLISVVLHAIVFLTFPKWNSFLISDVPGMADGGVIQVMHIESSVNPRPSPITDPLSQSTIPRVTEPRPTPESKPTEAAVAQPKPAEVEKPVLEQSKPALASEPEEAPVLEEPVPYEPTPEETGESGPGEILTSESGTEAVIQDESESRTVIEPPTEPKPEPTPRPTQTDSSGSGHGILGEQDNVGTTQSGEGEAETAPPAPPPPPSGRSLHVGGGTPLYPKNAEHDGVEGTVKLAASVASSGEIISVVIVESSGDTRLDQQALRTIQLGWKFKDAQYDYLIDLEVIFTRQQDGYTTDVQYGEVEWINVP